ncbi:hypothetical protein EI94DRAFT_1741307 [Lactarius quietus]|nr:hypothetical protein EI94DRAFT_1741307 [Lactarius quietus]
MFVVACEITAKSLRDSGLCQAACRLEYRNLGRERRTTSVMLKCSISIPYQIVHAGLCKPRQEPRVMFLILSHPLPVVHMAADSYLEALAEAEHKIYHCIALTVVQFINPPIRSVAAAGETSKSQPCPKGIVTTHQVAAIFFLAFLRHLALSVTHIGQHSVSAFFNYEPQPIQIRGLSHDANLSS